MMKKLNPVVYQKLLLQAEEAKDRKMIKLANGILSSLTPTPEDEQLSYDYDQLQDDVYQDLWKAATCILKYYDVKSADAEKIHEALEAVASKLIEEVEHSLSVKHTQVGPLEPKVPGQSE
jgi:hypothetical protein